MPSLETPAVKNLGRIVEESTRSTREGVKFFIEPAPGTLARAKNRRHHIIFGRRGSGKSSLLAKLTEDLTINRTPTAYVDLEEFKGHSYPDVLLSVLIKTFDSFKKWLETAAVNPANKTSFWKKFFGSAPKRSGFNRVNTNALIKEISELITELNQYLFSAEESKQQLASKVGNKGELKTAISSQIGAPGANAKASIGQTDSQSDERQFTSEYV